MKQLILFASVLGTLTFAACGGKKEETTDQTVPAGMMALDLSKYGKNVIINVPDTTNGPLVVEDMGGAVRISVGKGFQIQVKEGEGNLEMKKNEDIKKNEVYKFDKFSVEEPNAVVYAWHMEGGQPEYRMFAAIKVGQITYEVEDVAGEVFSETACQKMLESAKSLHEKETKKPEA